MRSEEKEQAISKKKELSRNYIHVLGSEATEWERKNLTGIIYKIINLIDGKSYIGQTKDWFDERYKSGKWWKHTTNMPLQRAVIKYGTENFRVEIIEYNIKTIKELNKLETMYILLFNTFIDFGEGYNLDFGGKNKNCSKLTKIKLSIAGSGKNNYNYGRTGERSHNFGRKRTEETRKKISESLLGKTISIETRRKLSEAQKGEKSYMFGKKLSAEVRLKISKVHKGKKHSQEWSDNISLSLKNSEKNKKNLSKLHFSSKIPVIQFDKNTGELIKIWGSATDAGNSLCISNKCISATCKGDKKSSGGFKWGYAIY